MIRLSRFVLLVAAMIGLAGEAWAQSLTAAEVTQVLAQAANEAEARGQPATIAVVDRVGNVLGVFRMTGANNADPGFAALGVAADASIRTVTVASKPNGGAAPNVYRGL